MAINGYRPIGKRGDKIISDKIGSSGPSDEYNRGRFKEQKRVLTLAGDESLEHELEREVLLNTIIGEIETWAGKSLEKIFTPEIKRGLNEKIGDYAKRLAEALKATAEFEKENSEVINWVEQLETIK